MDIDVVCNFQTFEYQCLVIEIITGRMKLDQGIKGNIKERKCKTEISGWFPSLHYPSALISYFQQAIA